MIEMLENIALDLSKGDIEKATTISIRGTGEYLVSRDYEKAGASGLRIYSCDADCDSCHCATF